MRRCVSFCLLLVGCQGGVAPEPEVVANEVLWEHEEGGDPSVEAPTANEPSDRQMQRMTAAQFNASLQVATGQSWSDFGKYARLLGQPDYLEQTDENTEIGVSFAKLIGDAARSTCLSAITADLNLAQAEERVILRHVDALERTPSALARNVRYLIFRFLGIYVETDTDDRIAPWLGILLTSKANEEPWTEADMAERWRAVCVGLVTHPDFITY